MKTLHNLFEREIDDLYCSASEMLKILKRMSSISTHPQIVELFDTYYNQTKYQKKKLEEVFDRFSEATIPKGCKIMQKIRDFGQASMHYRGSSEIRDIVLLVAVNMIKHFEKTLYGTLLTHAKRMKREDLVDVLTSMKKKIAEDETKPQKLAQELLENAKTPSIKEEAAALFATLMQTQIEEEKKLLSFLPKLQQEVDHEGVKEALSTYQNAHQSSLKQLISTASEQAKGIEISDWDIIDSYISETQGYISGFGAQPIKDIGIILSLQRIQHQNMAILEFVKLLSGFSGHSKIQSQFQTMLNLEVGYDQSLSALAEGSFFTEGLDAKAKP